jgi:single-strand selective monofunctional uracil DNA glycosylase
MTAMELAQIIKQLSNDLDHLDFGPPVSHVYNPLGYAWQAHQTYLKRYGAAPKEVVLIGMNPGPWGMAQTGVPFGEVAAVRDWLGIECPVGRPAEEHPKRPVQGFDCPRSEVSGRRLWGWAQETFASAEAFSNRFFVYNYCPLMFLEESGRNLTPDRLPAAERAPLLAACDQTLRQVVEHLQPRVVVGIGGFAAKRATTALSEVSIQVGQILHPSPASPAANRGWAAQAERDLERLQISVP